MGTGVSRAVLLASQVYQELQLDEYPFVPAGVCNASLADVCVVLPPDLCGQHCDGQLWLEFRARVHTRAGITHVRCKLTGAYSDLRVMVGILFCNVAWDPMSSPADSIRPMEQPVGAIGTTSQTRLRTFGVLVHTVMALFAAHPPPLLLEQLAVFAIFADETMRAEAAQRMSPGPWQLLWESHGNQSIHLLHTTPASLQCVMCDAALPHYHVVCPGSITGGTMREHYAAVRVLNPSSTGPFVSDATPSFPSDTACDCWCAFQLGDEDAMQQWFQEVCDAMLQAPTGNTAVPVRPCREVQNAAPHSATHTHHGACTECGLALNIGHMSQHAGVFQCHSCGALLCEICERSEVNPTQQGSLCKACSREEET